MDRTSVPLPRLARRPDVQGLRAIAVALVILDHAGVPGVRGGFVGVDVFFVVSGFLISSLLLHEATETGVVRIGAFYARRARRILPAATVVLVVTSVVAAVELSVTRVAEIVEDVRWSALFAANVHFARLGVDYFGQGRAPSPVQHFWSLAVEEQFYLVWPALLVLVFTMVPRRKLTVVSLVVAAIWVLSLAWSVVQTIQSPTEAYFSSATRAWELATGTALALAGHSLARLPAVPRIVLSSLGIGAIVTAAVAFDAATPFPGSAALLPVLGTAAVLAGGARGVVGPGRLLALTPLRYTGDISYSLYLWHWPVLVLGVEFVDLSRTPARTSLLVAVTVVLAVLSYHFVENPVRRSHGPALRGRRALVLWPMAAAVVLLSSGWSLAHATDAFQARVSGDGHSNSRAAADRDTPAGRARPRNGVADRAEASIRVRLLRAVSLADRRAAIRFPLVNLEHLADDVWQRTYSCYASWDEATHELCRLGDQDATRTVVVYGDSHAGMWLPSLDALGERDGFSVLPFVKVGCAPFDVEQTHLGAAFPDCPAFRAWATRQIKTAHPQVVVLAYRGLLAMREPAGPGAEAAWSAGVRTSIQRLRDLSPTVEVLSDITSLGFSPADCVTDPESNLGSCTQTEQQTTAVANQLTARAARLQGAEYVDVTGLVCVNRRCPLVVDDIVTYRDPWHISVTWGEQVTPELGPMLDLAAPRARPTTRPGA